MEMQAKLELVNLLRDRYRLARKKDKSKIFDEFVAITGNHRRHALRMLAVPKEHAASICLLRYAELANASLHSIEKISVTSLVEATREVILIVAIHRVSENIRTR